MEDIKVFETKSQYESFAALKPDELPVISYCKYENEIFHNPVVKNYYLKLKYNVTSTSEATPLITEASLVNVEEIIIDGKVISPLAASYIFNTTGEHEVWFKFNYATISYDNSIGVALGFFDGTTPVTEIIEIPTDLLYLTDGAFGSCNTIVKANLKTPHGKLKVVRNTPINGTNLKEIIFPDTVELFGGSAFSYCPVLTELKLPNSIKTIGEGSFSSIPLLTELIFPNSTETVHEGAFSGCSNIERVVLSPNMTSVKAGWGNNTNLKELVIPEGVKKFEAGSMYGCGVLNNIISHSNEAPKLVDGSFNGIGPNGTLYIPYGCINNYNSWIEKLKPLGWKIETIDEKDIPLYIEALEDDMQIKFSNNIEYSLDNKTWHILKSYMNSISFNKGQKIYFRGNLTPSSSSGVGRFNINKKCNIGGNVMSLLFGDNFIGKTDLTGYDYAFNNLFGNCTTIQSAANLSLPATTLSSNCYGYMFTNCDAMISAPELPATTLAEKCYYYMFQNCFSLTSAPELPATTLANNCYERMFDGCTSLTTAPVLPATTLASSCYRNMFNGCTGLTSAPELPATTLAEKCYYYMFQKCTSLTSAPELPATTLANYCYNGMFDGCTSLTTAPELPATTMYSYCYSDMFRGCTSLTTAPAILPATTLAVHCYYYMFYGCNNLTTAPELPATTLASSCYRNMFVGCKTLTSAPKLPATKLASSCYQQMFEFCTSLTSAPELPATTLADYCYAYMFDGCTSLTTAPVLPATTLKSYCYREMFKNCTNLNYIKAMFTTTPSSSYTYSWVSGVASTGTFVKNANATWNVTGSNGIPSGWTVQTA